MTDDPYAFWHTQLAGKPIDLDDKLPRVGFYRKSDQPIAIWVDKGSGHMVAKVGKGRIQPADAGFAEQVFAWCCRNAITHEVYTTVMAGGPWPDDIESLDAAKANFPADPYEALLAELELLEMKIAEFFKEPVAIGDNVRGIQADKWKARAAQIWKDIEALREVEKKPFDDGKASVQAKFKPHLARALSLKETAIKGMQSYQIAKDDAEVEAKRQAREAELAAAKAMDEPPPPEKQQPRGRSTVATGGTTVFRQKVAVITDLAAVAGFYVGQPTPWPDLVEMLRKMAEKNLKGGVAVPGAELREERSVR